MYISKLYTMKFNKDLILRINLYCMNWNTRGLVRVKNVINKYCGQSCAATLEITTAYNVRFAITSLC